MKASGTTRTRCTTCKKLFGPDRFYPSVPRRCKVCVADSHARWRNSNPERAREIAIRAKAKIRAKELERRERLGIVVKRGVKPIPEEFRFWRNVSKRGEDECWNWRKTKNRPIFQLDNSKRPTCSAVAWMLTNGPVPPGLCVCHSCDNPWCCNPKHLWIGTKGDNNRDARNKGIMSMGERHPFAKLTVSKVCAARKMNANGISVQALASKYGISLGSMNAAIRGITWNHVTKVPPNPPTKRCRKNHADDAFTQAFEQGATE